jgi:hypothetical protein
VLPPPLAAIVISSAVISGAKLERTRGKAFTDALADVSFMGTVP